MVRTAILNNGRRMPTVGFCTKKIPVDGMTYRSVRDALRLGYRHIETAASYYNEAEVGEAVRGSGLPRSEAFVTTKLARSVCGYDETTKALEKSLDKLGLDYIDLYVADEPNDTFMETWRAMEDAQDKGLVHSLGAANMTPELWEEYAPRFATPPAVLFEDCQPYFQQRPLRKLVAPLGVCVVAQAPEGHWNAKVTAEPLVVELAGKYGRTANQIVLRFQVQDGLILLPKPSTPKRIAQALQIFDFRLTEEEMQALRGLNREFYEESPAGLFDSDEDVFIAGQARPWDDQDELL